MSIRKLRTVALTASCLAVCCQAAFSQGTPPATILEIDLENRVQYLGDISDVSKLASDPNVTTPLPSKNFVPVLIMADIVAVNGQRVMGTSVFHIRQINLRTAPNAGEAIADVVRNNVVDIRFEVLKTDGTPIGTIMASGLGGGAAPPGAPSGVRVGNVAIVGGTGAFLGARGQVGQGMTTTPDRNASMTEDPANRRRNGGGRVRYVLQVIPMLWPRIVTVSSGSALLYSNQPATLDGWAMRGELLSAQVSGLGPTQPGVDPGQPFPANPASAVNSPVQVLVNGRSAEVLRAVGIPGAIDLYQVDFRIPPDTPQGYATIQLTTAWIAGSVAAIGVR